MMFAPPVRPLESISYGMECATTRVPRDCTLKTTSVICVPQTVLRAQTSTPVPAVRRDPLL
jgi:hypothetical protein